MKRGQEVLINSICVLKEEENVVTYNILHSVFTNNLTILLYVYMFWEREKLGIA